MWAFGVGVALDAPRAVSRVDVAECTLIRFLSSRFARAPASNYLCSLGTNTVLGNSTNGLFGVLLDDGPVN